MKQFFIPYSEDEFKALMQGLLREELQRIGIAANGGSSDKEIISAKVLCQRLDISEPTLISWRKKKKIPFMKVGSRGFRYDWEAVCKALSQKVNGGQN